LLIGATIVEYRGSLFIREEEELTDDVDETNVCRALDFIMDERNKYQLNNGSGLFCQYYFDGLVRTPHMVAWQNKVGLYISLNITTILSAKPVLSPTNRN